MFSTLLKTNFIFWVTFILSSANDFNLDWSTILLRGKEFILSQMTKLDSSKLKDIADDNFESDENGVKFSKGVENAVGKGEIACHKRFLLFPQLLQITFSADM